MVGRHDVATPMEQGVEIHRRIDASELAVLEHSGHNPWAEEPDRFAEVLHGFLGRQGLTASGDADA